MSAKKQEVQFTGFVETVVYGRGTKAVTFSLRNISAIFLNAHGMQTQRALSGDRTFIMSEKDKERLLSKGEEVQEGQKLRLCMDWRSCAESLTGTRNDLARKTVAQWHRGIPKARYDITSFDIIQQAPGAKAA